MEKKQVSLNPCCNGIYSMSSIKCSTQLAL